MNLYKIALILFIVQNLTSNNVNGQELHDTISANRDFLLADSLLVLKHYSDASDYYLNAAKKFKEAGAVNRYFEALLSSVHINRSAKEREVNLALGNQILRESSLALGNNNRFYGPASLILGEIYNGIGNYKLAHKYYKQALDVFSLDVTSNCIQLGDTYHNLGNMFYFLGLYKSALKHYTLGLDLYLKCLDKVDDKIALSYNNIGISHHAIGSYDLALEYYKKSKHIWSLAYGPKNIRACIFLSNIAGIYTAKGLTREALQNYRQSLEIAHEELGENHYIVANNCQSIGYAYSFFGDYSLAHEYHLRALKIRSNLYGNNDHRVASSNKAIGFNFKLQDNNYRALHYYNRALKILEVLQGKGPQIAELNNMVAKFYFDSEDYDTAFEYYHSALISNLADSSETMMLEHLDWVELRIPIYGINSLLGKALSLEKGALKNNSIADLQKALKNVQLADSILVKGRVALLKHSDKLEMNKKAPLIYETGIRICLKLYDVTNEPIYKEKAYHFVEKGRSGLLMDALIDISAKHGGLVSEGLLEMEQQIKGSQNYVRSLLAEIKAKRSDYDSSEISVLEDDLFNLNRSADSLTLVMEENYPNYHELKYNHDVPTVRYVRSKLAENEALLEYLIGDSVTYLFVISKHTYEVLILNQDSTLKNEVFKLRESLRNNVLGDGKSYSNYTTSANKLYEDFLYPALRILESGIDKLIIIPDGYLTYIPFDILLTDSNEEVKVAYEVLPYLIRSYQTSYAYSARELFGSLAGKKNKATRGFIAFAPSYEGSENDSAFDQSRGRFTSLNYNQSEIEGVNKYMHGSVFKGKMATESALKKLGGEHSIIHLAMHAMLDDKNPMNSKLIFTQAQDSLEDNYLHAFELYNTTISANLVVLSACETGFGKLQKGEGVMSLARAFSYSGCPSVVMSLWSVNDAATAKLMKYFYKYLIEGQPKDKALRSAKLEFLNNADAVQSNPFFWGAFVVMGDTASIEIKRQPRVLIYLIVVFAMTVVALSAIAFKNGGVSKIREMFSFYDSSSK